MKSLKEKGITLIALVITIIILLILAGITIGTITGENGLFRRSKDAAKKYKDAAAQEENDLIHLGEILENHTEVKPPDLEKGDIEFILNPNKWTNNVVKVSIKVNINLGINKIQTSVDGLGWEDYEIGKEIEVEENKTTVYARLWNGVKAGGYASETVNNIDRLPPASVSFTEEHTTSSIKVTASATDAEATETDGKSEIGTYYFSKDGGTNWEPKDESGQVVGQTNPEYTFKDLQSGTYTIKVKVKDNAGNEKEDMKEITLLPASYCLTIKYVDENGKEIIPDKIMDWTAGEKIEIPPLPAEFMEDYTPNVPLEDINEVMPYSDYTLTVHYTAIKYTLTIKFIYEDGREAVKTYTRQYMYGESYNVGSPIIPGYNPTQQRIYGTMPRENLNFTVTYVSVL